MADWVTISSLATASGTLVLAISTFAAVHSANRSNRVTERALLVGIRPVLVPSRFDVPVEKVGFSDEHWVKVPGGRATVEVTDGAICLVPSIRNVGAGWRCSTAGTCRADASSPPTRAGSSTATPPRSGA